ncbi:MAG TPA: hypothetical protein VF974_00820 [Patescibacteria group bacterium]
MNTIDRSNYLSCQEAASEFGMNAQFIRDEIKRGNLIALKVSKVKYLINKQEWEAYKKNKETA